MTIKTLLVDLICNIVRFNKTVIVQTKVWKVSCNISISGRLSYFFHSFSFSLQKTIFQFATLLSSETCFVTSEKIRFMVIWFTSKQFCCFLPRFKALEVKEPETGKKCLFFTTIFVASSPSCSLLRCVLYFLCFSFSSLLFCCCLFLCSSSLTFKMVL